MLMKTTIKEVLEKINDSVDYINENNINEIIDLIINSKNVFLVGAGRSGLVAKSFAIRLMQIGISVYIVGDAVTPAVCKDDCICALSGSGETKSVHLTVKTAKEIGSKVVLFTSNPNSRIAKLSDVICHIKTSKIVRDENDHIFRKLKGEYSSLTPLGTLFELTSMVFLDGLIAELMMILHKTESDLKDRHATLE
ncbi:MAG: 6-phospho-3-hexuloisomerase [Methanobrevibacter sp.]|nr:6-phospho-3-hexuloisomerase [Candidatus Methanovirga australis]